MIGQPSSSLSSSSSPLSLQQRRQQQPATTRMSWNAMIVEAEDVTMPGKNVRERENQRRRSRLRFWKERSHALPPNIS